MRIFLRKSAASANVLMVALVITGLMGLVLVSYLTMVGSQSSLTARSQVFNGCIAVAEAGVEEALAHMNKNGVLIPGKSIFDIKLDTYGWEVRTNGLFKQSSMGDGFYQVTIKPGVKPVITSTGFLPVQDRFTASASSALLATTSGELKNNRIYVSRTVQVTLRGIGRYNKAIVAKERIDLNGKYVKIDSYNSYDTAASTYNGTNGWGLYDPLKRRDNGDVAVMGGFSDALDVNDAKVWGKAATSPQGDMKLTKNAVVGSIGWHAAGKTGVEPGWSTDDANFDLSVINAPFSGGVNPLSGWVGTNFYDAILASGDYEISTLSGKVIVTGKARLIVKTGIAFKDDPKSDDGIEFDNEGSRLELYMQGKDTNLKGKKNKKKNPLSQRLGFNTEGNVTNFFYFGADKNTTVNLVNMDDFTGVIYAPRATVTLKAGSLKYYRCEMYGSIVGKKVTLEKNATLHYDENLALLPPDSYIVESWREL